MLSVRVRKIVSLSFITFRLSLYSVVPYDTPVYRTVFRTTVLIHAILTVPATRD
jgi:hypothetical protein